MGAFLRLGALDRLVCRAQAKTPRQARLPGSDNTEEAMAFSMLMGVPKRARSGIFIGGRRPLKSKPPPHLHRRRLSRLVRRLVRHRSRPQPLSAGQADRGRAAGPGSDGNLRLSTSERMLPSFPSRPFPRRRRPQPRRSRASFAILGGISAPRQTGLGRSSALKSSQPSLISPIMKRASARPAVDTEKPSVPVHFTT